jgi:CBS domain-containing protein
MPTGLRTPEQLLAYPPLKALLEGRAGTPVHAAAPGESVYEALNRMAELGIGFLVVLEGGQLAGVVSERDYARKVVLRDRASKDTPVRDIMTTKVVTVAPDRTIPQCIALMHEHGIRHLPVVEGGKVIGVLSVRDLLRAVVEHHERCIRELEVERMTMLNPNVSSY